MGAYNTRFAAPPCRCFEALKPKKAAAAAITNVNTPVEEEAVEPLETEKPGLEIVRKPKTLMQEEERALGSVSWTGKSTRQLI